jgi:hypothetical protein
MRASLFRTHFSLANAAKADFMVLLDSLYLKKIKNLVAFYRMQNGGEIQDGRQGIKCSRYVKTAPKNFNLWNLVN